MTEKKCLAETRLMTLPGLIRSNYYDLRLFEDRFEISGARENHAFRYEEVSAFAFHSVSSYINGMAQGPVSYTHLTLPTKA